MLELDVFVGRLKYLSPKLVLNILEVFWLLMGKSLQIGVVNSELAALYQRMMLKLARRFGSFTIPQNLALGMGIVGVNFQWTRGLQVHGGYLVRMTLS
tara:strand:+ start:44 stop:337 length:294 start_codon:yes stop_codon:yes gene_type:complete